MPSPAAATGTRAAPLPPGERRAAIVDAVLPLLLDHGAAVTSRQIAHAAGVAEGTIYKAFADKDELIAAAVDAALDQAPFEQAISEIDTGEHFERQLVLATEIIQRRVVDVWRLLSRLGSRHHTPGRLPDSPALTALFAANDDAIRTDPSAAARQLRATTLTLTHPQFVDTPYEAADIVDVFLHGSASR